MEVNSPIASVFHCFEDFLRKVGTMNVFETLVYNYRLKEEFLNHVRVEDFSAILSELIQNLTILRHELERVKVMVKVEEMKQASVVTNNDGQHLQIQQQHQPETTIFTASSAAEALNELQLRQACSNSNPLENNFINMITLDNATYLHVIQAEDVKNMQNVNVVVGQVEDLQTLLSMKGFLEQQNTGQHNGVMAEAIPVTNVQHHVPMSHAAPADPLQNNGEEKMEHNSEPGPPNNSEIFMIPILKQVIKSEDELSVNNICSMLGTSSDTSTHEEAQATHQPPPNKFQAPANVEKPKKKKVYSRTNANQQQTTTTAAASAEIENDESLMFYCCDKCFHSFRTEERFSVHKCTAKGGGRNSTLIKDNSGLRKMKKFVCGLCLEEYRNLDRISFHLKRCEGGPFTCEMCPASAPQFSTMKSLNFHKIHEHKEERSFICKDCGFPFKFKCSLQKHKLRAHNNELQPRTFPCDLCSSVFMKKIFLTNHKVKSHNVEKEFSCQVCGQSYTSQQSLKTHTDEAHDETNKFNCDQCDKVFTKKEQLDLHMAVHTGSSKAHLCETCGKSFSKKSKLDDHFRRRHAVGTQIFTCTSASCSKTFKTRKDQRQHFRRMHESERLVNNSTADGTDENRVKKKKKDKKLKRKDSSDASASVSSAPAPSNHDSSSSEGQEANGSSSKRAGAGMNNHSTSNSEMSSQGADENQLMSDFMEALTPGQLEQIIQADFLVPTLIP